MQKISLKELFLTCLKIGLILLGGGYVILPIMQQELVEKRNWITDEELVEYYTLSQSLPGIIAINTCLFIGYKLRGKLGALVSIIGLVFSAFWIIVALASVLTKLTSNSYIQGILWGVEIAVVVLIISAVRELWGKSMLNLFSYLIYTLALALMLIGKLSPVMTIITTVIIGLIIKIITKRGENNVG